MYCEKCGYDVVDGGKFCPKCGEEIHAPEMKFPTQNNAVNTANSINTENVQPEKKKDGMFSEQKMSENNGLSATVTIKDWLKLNCVSLLSLIPFVGPIVYLVLYFVIGFSDKTAISIKNNIKANIIWSLIITGVVILFLVVFSSVIIGIVSSINEYSMY